LSGAVPAHSRQPVDVTGGAFSREGSSRAFAAPESRFIHHRLKTGHSAGAGHSNGREARCQNCIPASTSRRRTRRAETAERMAKAPASNQGRSSLRFPLTYRRNSATGILRSFSEQREKLMRADNESSKLRAPPVARRPHRSGLAPLATLTLQTESLYYRIDN